MAGEKRSMPGNNQSAKRQKGQKVRSHPVPAFWLLLGMALKDKPRS